eukprot:12358839-Heterocapsa_arctica.AAC.1
MRPSEPSSLDLRNGWDLLNKKTQGQVWELLETQKPYLVLLEPECTMFCLLQDVFNNESKFSPEQWEIRWKEAVEHVAFCMRVASYQHENG